MNTNTVSSPFSVSAYEQLKPVQMSRSGRMPNSARFTLTDLGKVVLIGLNDLLVSTGNLLYRYCTEVMQLSGVTLQEFRKTLTGLSENGFLLMREFVTDTPTAVGKVYTLDKAGRDFVAATGRIPVKAGYLRDMNALQAKKLLSVQQLSLSYLQNPSTGVKFAAAICEQSPNGAGDHIFRTQALITAGKETLLLESLRRAADVPELTDKLKRMNATLTRSCYLNEQISDDVTVVVVCADDKTFTALTGDIQRSDRYCFKISAVTDQQVYRGDPAVALYTPRKRFWLF